jgi:hypothetical protein
MVTPVPEVQFLKCQSLITFIFLLEYISMGHTLKEENTPHGRNRERERNLKLECG